MAIESGRIYGGRGYEMGDSQNMPLLGAIISNRFFEDDYSFPEEFSYLWTGALSYQRNLGVGQMLPVLDSELECLELYVNVGGGDNSLQTYKFWNQYEPDPSRVVLEGKQTVYDDEAEMTADGWTLLKAKQVAGSGGQAPIEFTPPAAFYDFQVYNRLMPVNAKWWVGAGVVGYREDPPTDPFGSYRWTSGNSPSEWPLLVEAYRADNWGHDWGRIGWRIVTKSGLDWMVIRTDQYVNQNIYQPSLEYGCPVEIWIEPTKGQVVVKWGDWNVPSNYSDWNSRQWQSFQRYKIEHISISGGYNEYLGLPPNTINETESGKIAVGGVLAAFYERAMPIIVTINRDAPNVCGYGYKIQAGSPIDVVSQNWKKVDLYWPKIDPDTGKPADPFSTWHNPLAR